MDTNVKKMDENAPDFAFFEWLELVSPDALSEIKEIVKEKPYRITKAYRELLSGYTISSAKEIISVTEVVEPNTYAGLISGLDIDYMSFCAHHFLPYYGKVDVLYEPTDKIIGIGKLSRLVDYRTKRFNIQEKIAKEICADLMEFAGAKGAFARVSAKHSCLCYRGPTKYRSSNIVTYAVGSCRDKFTEISQHLGG